MEPEPPDDNDDPDAAVQAARARFVSGFAQACETMAALIARVRDTGAADAADELRQLLHRMGGLGGTIGLPTVSVVAREFEDFVRDAPESGLDVGDAQRRLEDLRHAFGDDISR